MVLMLMLILAESRFGKTCLNLGLERSGEVSVAIRPQSICLSQSGNENSIPGTILKAIYLGSHIEYTVDCILGELFVIDNQMESKQNLDAAVSITLRTRGVSLIPES